MDKRLGIGIILCVAAGAVAGGATAGPPQRQTTLSARIGQDPRSPSSGAAPAWARALFLRSDALNRRYRLGEYARSQSRPVEPDRLTALRARSEALNRAHRLGTYAISTPDLLGPTSAARRGPYLYSSSPASMRRRALAWRAPIRAEPASQATWSPRR